MLLEPRDPDVPPAPIWSVPVLIVVSPELVLLPLRMRVPVPVLVKAPVPAITPLKVVLLLDAPAVKL